MYINLLEAAMNLLCWLGYHLWLKAKIKNGNLYQICSICRSSRLVSYDPIKDRLVYGKVQRYPPSTEEEVP